MKTRARESAPRHGRVPASRSLIPPLVSIEAESQGSLPSRVRVAQHPPSEHQGIRGVQPGPTLTRRDFDTDTRGGPRISQPGTLSRALALTTRIYPKATHKQLRTQNLPRNLQHAAASQLCLPCHLLAGRVPELALRSELVFRRLSASAAALRSSQVHEELEVENWALRYIIGSKGSEMKHIQHNWKVTVKRNYTIETEQ